MKRIVPAACLLLTLLCVFNSPQVAQARRGGPMIINTGDKFFEIVEAADGSPAKLIADDAVVAYHCQNFGVLWLPLWTWDGEFCVYSEAEEKYQPLEADQLALMAGVSEDQIKKPFFYTFPLGLVILGAIVGIVIVVKVVGRGKNQTATAASQFSGPQPPGTAPPGAPPAAGPPPRQGGV